MRTDGRTDGQTEAKMPKLAALETRRSYKFIFAVVSVKGARAAQPEKTEDLTYIPNRLKSSGPA